MVMGVRSLLVWLVLTQPVQVSSVGETKEDRVETEEFVLEKPINVVALGLAKNCQAVLGERLKDMTKLACSPNINLTVRLMVSNASARFDANTTREIAKKYLFSPPKCGVGRRPAFVHYEFIEEPHPSKAPALFTSPKPLRDDERLVRLRWLREELRRHSAQVDKDKDVVVIADFDMEGFPATEAMRKAIWQAANSASSGYSTICGNGKMADAWSIKVHSKDSESVVVLDSQTYDTFATVLTNDLFIPKTKLHMRGKHRRSISKNISINNEDIYEVKSCFGGMAVYNRKTYFNPTCNYTHGYPGHPHAFPTLSRLPCEHVVFHLCLKENEPSYKIGIGKHMKLYRHFRSHGDAPRIVVRGGKLTTVKKKQNSPGSKLKKNLDPVEEVRVRAELMERFTAFRKKVEEAIEKYGPEPEVKSQNPWIAKTSMPG